MERLAALEAERKRVEEEKKAAEEAAKRAREEAARKRAEEEREEASRSKARATQGSSLTITRKRWRPPEMGDPRLTRQRPSGTGDGGGKVGGMGAGRITACAGFITDAAIWTPGVARRPTGPLPPDNCLIASWTIV